VIGANLAAQGVQGVAVMTLGPLTEMQDRSEKDRCLVYARNGISVVETLESAVAAREPNVATYDPAFWRPEFARDGYPQVESRRIPVEGTLAIADRFVAFVAPPGTISVRIPFELVQGVDIQPVAMTEKPRALVIRSCDGRFDILTFQSPGRLDSDPDVMAAAAATLQERVAHFRANSDR
jgi:hypothetical protein